MIHYVLFSLRTRLLLLVLLAGVPSVGLMLLTAVEQRRSAEAAVERDALRLVRQTVAAQERLIEEGRLLLVSLSRVPVVRSGTPDECRALLADVLQQFPHYFNLSVVRPSGDTYCSGRPLVAANIADRPFFQDVVRTQTFVVSDFVLGRATGRPNLALAHPVLDGAGQLNGVLVGGFELTEMSDLVGEAACQPDQPSLLSIVRVSC